MAPSNNDINRPSEASSNDDSNGLTLVEYEDSLQRLGGDASLFIEFVNIFFEDSPQLLAKIFTSVDSNDHLALTKSAHALKGMMLSFGAKPCCKLAAEFELAGKNEVTASMSVQKATMQELYDLLCEELKTFAKK